MRGIASKRAAVAVALATLSAIAGGMPGARANHGSDAAGWIEQAGNGNGGSTPLLSNFSLGTVLFHPMRFPVRACETNVASCTQRPGFAKFAAWGTITTEDDTVLAYVKGGDDGLSWQAPSPAQLRDSATGEDVPFVMNGDNGHFDVVYTGEDTGGFRIYYLTPKPEGETGTVEAYTINRFHTAQSHDGINWFNDRELTQGGAGSEVVLGSRASYGPTDVIFQAAPTGACTTATPWSCKYVMIYDRVDVNAEQLGIAGSADGTLFNGSPTPLLTVGAPGEWDDDAATEGHVRKVGSSYQLTYAGGPAPDTACNGGNQGCWSIGVATSGDGLTFTKAANNPATPHALLEGFRTDGPVTVRNPQAVADASGSGHAKIYFTVVGNTGTRDTYLASTAPAPACGTTSGPCTYPPAVRLGSPVGGASTRNVPLSLYLSDSLGTAVGIDVPSITVTLDGAALPSYTIDRSLVTATTTPAYKVASSLSLAEGAHTIAVAVKDLDGNLTTKTFSFFVDTTAPQTILSGRPASPQIGFPDSIGTYSGVSTDAGFGLAKVRAVFTDPLGRKTTFDSTQKDRWILTKTSANEWAWRFVAPSMDPFFVVPGNYTVSILGVDAAGANEAPNSANTMQVQVV